MNKRHSKKREAILDCICGTDTHPSAEWVYSRLKHDYPDLSLGTVYRNIALFRSEGSVACVGSVCGTDRFDGNILPHAHFICEGCGAVIDIEAGVHEVLSERVEREYGVSVTRNELVFRGTCRECKSKI